MLRYTDENIAKIKDPQKRAAAYEKRARMMEKSQASLQALMDTLVTKNGRSVKIRDGEISYGKEGGPIAGARATVDTAGQLEKRVTATRLLLTGPLAFGLRKKKDSRELYLLVEGAGFAFSAELDPKRGAVARKFAARINALGQVEAADPVAESAPSSLPADDRLDKLQQLVSLRDAGALTAEEFAAEKARVMSGIPRRP